MFFCYSSYMQNDFNPKILDLDIERTLAASIANGFHPVGILVESGGSVWVESPAGLIPMPQAVITSRGFMRMFRKPLPGETIEANRALNADDF